METIEKITSFWKEVKKEAILFSVAEQLGASYQNIQRMTEGLSSEQIESIGVQGLVCYYKEVYL